MGFDDLPSFPQGGIARADSGNQGIPPESFQQALQDAGSQLITSTKRPEDNPAVQAAMSAEVDTLTQELGLGQPVAPAPGAPAKPDTPQVPGAPQASAPTSPAPSSGDLSERIRRVMEKYSSPEEIAKAYIHTDAARTRAQQDRANEISALSQQVARLSAMLEQRNATSYAPPSPLRASTPSPGYGMPAPAVPDDPEEFFKKPAENIRAILEPMLDEKIGAHLSAYSQAQARFAQQREFEHKRAAMQKDIERLKPFMDEIYMKDRDLYDALPQDRALTLLVDRARDREEAYRARAYHEEITQLLGGNGTPANAAPGQTGALPSGSAGRRPEAPQGGNWSNTPAFNKLWKARSDSVDELATVTDILKERGFGEDTRIY